MAGGGFSATEPATKPPTLPVIAEEVPPALTDRRQWVVWRWEWSDQQRKWTKPPYRADGRGKASSTDPRTWAPFAAALAAYRTGGWDGLGFVLTADDPFAGVDLDGCRDPATGELTSEPAATVAALDSYVEASPSGSGARVFLHAPLPPDAGTGRRKGPVELYGAGRYLTVTGHRLPGAPATVNARPEALAAFYARAFGPSGAAPGSGAGPNGHRAAPPLADDEVLARCRGAKNADKFVRLWAGDAAGHGGDDSAADLALLSLLGFYTADSAQLDRLFRRSGLYREKWERADYRERSIARALDRAETWSPAGGTNLIYKGEAHDGTDCGVGAEEEAAVAADDSPSAGRDLLDAVHSFLGRFVAYPSGATRAAHTLWVAHAHLMDAWESTPRLAFLSPEPASGKTRALEITELLVPNPVEAVSVSAAYLFRKVGDEGERPTILYDEIDTVFGPKAKENEEIRGLLNAGHRKGAIAGRCVVRGKEVVTVDYPAYCAVALAGLGDLPDTILSRSVIVRMRRRAPGERVE
jgi:hypothetical protein